MPGLTQLGIIHTAISLVALGAGIAAFVQHREISWRTLAGRLYVVATVLTCLTGFGIFQHGGFGRAHVLGVITLVVLAVAGAASRGRFGKWSAYVETGGYTLTFFFHLVPALTETATRLPAAKPLARGPDDPTLLGAIGACFVWMLVGLIFQFRRLHARDGR